MKIFLPIRPQHGEIAGRNKNTCASGIWKYNYYPRYRSAIPKKPWFDTDTV